MREFLNNLDKKTIAIFFSFLTMSLSLSYKFVSKDKLNKKIFWSQFLWGVSVVTIFMPAINHHTNLHITYYCAITWFITFLPNIFIRFVLEKIGVPKDQIDKEF